MSILPKFRKRGDEEKERAQLTFSAKAAYINIGFLILLYRYFMFK